MRSFSTRSILALTAMLFCVSCYGPSGQVRTDVRYSSNGTQAEPVRVGSRVDFNTSSGREVVIAVTETPICAPVGGVTRTTTRTPIREKRGSSDGTAAIWIGVGGTMGGSAILTNSLINEDLGDEQRRSRALLGGALLAVGGVTLMSFFIRSNQPYSKDGKPTTSQTNGVGIAMDQKQWVDCGPPRPFDVTFDVTLAVDKKRFSTQMRSGSDGTLVLSQAFLRAVGDAEALCGRPVSLTVNMANSSRQRYSSSSRVNTQDILQSRRSLTGNSRPVTQWNVPFSGNNWLEFGPGAGTPGNQFPDKSRIYNSSTQRSSFNVRASSLKRPGANTGPSIARDAVAYCSSQWKTSCVQSTRGRFSGECSTSCYNADAVETCELKHEICIEQTAGIGGTLAQQCDKQKSSCIRSAGQDPSSRNACRDRCMTRRAKAECK